jgi:transposase
MEDHKLLPGMESVEVSQSSATDKPVDFAALRFKRPDRTQASLLPCVLDDTIPPDHQVRLVWAVVEQMDLSAFAERLKVQEGEAGRPATDIRLLVALWLWAATECIGSARLLERLCVENDTYRWLCGGVNVNHHTLSDFRVGHGKALDDLLSGTVASFLAGNLVTVKRISQDGLRVRASAGNNSFRRRPRLEQRLAEAVAHVEALKSQVDTPDAGDVNRRQEAARLRAAQERARRTAKALEALAQVEELRKKATGGTNSKKEPRASTTDPDARVMKLPGGAFQPAYNVQLATDTGSRVIVGVDVTNSGSDRAESEPMREQVEERTGCKVGEHLVDGGYVKFEQLERAEQAGVKVYAPPQARKNADPYQVQESDSPEVAQWRGRMASEEGKTIYKERASTSETVNADLRTYRGLRPFLVRGLSKVKCVVLWSVLAYNLLHMGKALLMS